jgi:hypothetical protein
MYVHDIEMHSCNHCCSGKARKYYTTCVCIVALGIQPAMSTRHVVICRLPTSTIFSTVSHKQHY